MPLGIIFLTPQCDLASLPPRQYFRIGHGLVSAVMPLEISLLQTDQITAAFLDPLPKLIA
ncbi:MAG: hypothetical protein DWQ35_01525 [Planctomycetota bacterium]|nr:MAG: hypothetical protein DWQ35_01525 [Planctomycetota bacterium]